MPPSSQPASPPPSTQPPSPSPQTSPEVSITLARPTDLPAIKSLITATYTKYIPRIGRPPAPMLQSHLPAIEAGHIHLLRLNTNTNNSPNDPNLPNPNNNIISSIHITPQDSDSDTMHINDLVISPSHQSRGYGRLLMEFAERLAREMSARALKLYTNEMMWENLVVYGRMGFRETERKVEDGYKRVYFRKEVVDGGEGERRGGGTLRWGWGWKGGGGLMEVWGEFEGGGKGG